MSLISVLSCGCWLALLVEVLIVNPKPASLLFMETSAHITIHDSTYWTETPIWRTSRNTVNGRILRRLLCFTTPKIPHLPVVSRLSTPRNGIVVRPAMSSAKYVSATRRGDLPASRTKLLFSLGGLLPKEIAPFHQDEKRMSHEENNKDNPIPPNRS
eukprot:GHVQ01015756.1.p1 GENE.GHVQ01015756.1~~GHVQ01015756.1.p1  ORF type:complete len:157 (-),score=14.52 GHVQ01015756.1:321-791(-)